MEHFSKEANISAVDALMDARDECKLRLVDRCEIAEAVSDLLSFGFRSEEIARCLVRYFYVDLDMLEETLALH